MKHAKPGSMDVEVVPVLLAECVPSSADSLVSTNVADDMENEQTWPTEEEMAGALCSTGEDGVPNAKKGTTPKRIKRIPKGMSEYQASWIVDESDDDENENEEHEEGDKIGGGQIDEDEEMVPLDDAADIENERKSVVAFQELDMEEEQKQCVIFISLVHSSARLMARPIAADLHHGASALRKSRMPSLSQMKLIPHKISRHACGSRGTAGCNPSVRVHGTPMRTCLASTHVYLSLRTLSALSGTCGVSWRTVVSRFGVLMLNDLIC